ncbi:MAG: hypothetical protein ABR990_04250 [Terracidiphilus sp.]
MTIQTNSLKCLGGSPAGINVSRLCTLTLAAILLTGGAVAGFGQAQPDAAKPAKPVPTKPVPEKTTAAVPGETVSHGYLVHQSLEVGGRYTKTSGSTAMWDTLVNQGSGGRILGQSLELHSINPSKTPIFDNLSTYSTGYGGDPYDISRLKMNKGRWYNFAGSFRRDRNFFDDNQLASSLLTTFTATAPPLVTENDSLHMFNTVRRNTDTALTLLPLSVVSFRAGYNHGTHEGPSYSSVHNGGDVQVLNYFRKGSDTFTGGVDVKLAKRTSVSYDQFFVLYKGDSWFQLAGANYTLNTTTTPVSLGVDVLGGTTVCGSTSTVLANGTKLTAATEPLEVSGGVVSQYCTGTIIQSQTAPTRTSFPTEQLRFSSHYWDKVSFNGRLLYSGDTSKVKSFNEIFNGLGRSNVRQTIENGGGANGQFADNKRINTSGDFGMIAELSKHLSFSDAFSSWDTRTWGTTNNTTETWTGNSGSVGPPIVPTTTMLTPLTDPSVTTSVVTSTAATWAGNATTPAFLSQKIIQNTALATATINPLLKVSGGWRFKSREISDPHATNLTWHENWGLFGGVLQPSKMVRVNVNYEMMNSLYASGSAFDSEVVATAPFAPLTHSNTFTREAPNKSYHIRVRATVKPAKWVDLATTASIYSAKNDDPMVNHTEHNDDLSFAASIHPNEQLSLDFNYAHDSVASSTNLCYIFTANANAPLPSTAYNMGTCTVANSPSGYGGASGLYLGFGTYNAPANFFSGSINYALSKDLHFNGGVRLNDVTNGQAEMLNPLMAPGGLQSRYLIPFADVEYKIASDWAWHANWVHDGYTETGAWSPTLPSRTTQGDIITLGVKYAF